MRKATATSSLSSLQPISRPSSRLLRSPHRAPVTERTVMTISRREFMQWVTAAAGAAAVGGCATTGGSSGRVVVIGAGYGGATAAKYVKLWAPDIDVTLV